MVLMTDDSSPADPPYLCEVETDPYRLSREIMTGKLRLGKQCCARCVVGYSHPARALRRYLPIGSVSAKGFAPGVRRTGVSLVPPNTLAIILAGWLAGCKLPVILTIHLSTHFQYTYILSTRKMTIVFYLLPVL